MAFTRVFFKILLPGRHSLGGRELEATGILNFSPSLYMYIIYVVIYYVMYRFLAAGSLNKSDQETDIDGPEPSWQLAQQGPSVPSKEKSGIREKRIWDALEIFRSSWKFYWVHYCSNRSSLTSSCSFAWLEPHDGMKLDEGGLEEPGWFIWFGVSRFWQRP